MLSYHTSIVGSTPAGSRRLVFVELDLCTQIIDTRTRNSSSRVLVCCTIIAAVVSAMVVAWDKYGRHVHAQTSSASSICTKNTYLVLRRDVRDVDGRVLLHCCVHIIQGTETNRYIIYTLRVVARALSRSSSLAQPASLSARATLQYI